MTADPGSKDIPIVNSQTPGLRSVHLTNSHPLDLRDLESFETTNLKTLNYVESP